MDQSLKVRPNYSTEQSTGVVGLALPLSCYFADVMLLYHCHAPLQLLCGLPLSCCLTTDHAAQPLMLLLDYCHDTLPIMLPASFMLLYTNVMLLASVTLFSCFHAICHCHTALSVRLLASIMLLFLALSHCLTLSGYLAATCLFDSVMLLCWCHTASLLSCWFISNVAQPLP